MTRYAVDTSVAIPLVLKDHLAHAVTTALIGDRQLFLAGHAAYETFSTMTRLPGDNRVAPDDAIAILNDRFLGVLLLADEPLVVLGRFAQKGIAGGAVYDALVAESARASHDIVLLSRDLRAANTYARIGVSVEMLLTT